MKKEHKEKKKVTIKEPEKFKLVVEDKKLPIIRIRVHINYNEDDDLGDIIKFLNIKIPQIILEDFELKHHFIVEKKDDIEDVKVIYKITLRGKEKDVIEKLIDSLKAITHNDFTSDVSVTLQKQYITTKI